MSMNLHPLTTFVYETLGQQFGDLLLAGYGEEPGSGRRKLYITESETEGEANWVIELVTFRPLCGDEPLVLAALIKLLLSRPVISHLLEFETDELLSELRWPNNSDTRRQVEAIIVGYAGLLYDKRVGARAGRRSSEISGGGCYHLLTGYIRGAESGIGESLVRTGGSVYFDDNFISGLNEGQVRFAGIYFGLLRVTR
jgi:hypothetical protein